MRFGGHGDGHRVDLPFKRLNAIERRRAKLGRYCSGTIAVDIHHRFEPNLIELRQNAGVMSAEMPDTHHCHPGGTVRGHRYKSPQASTRT